MARKLSPGLKAAIRAYYEHRKLKNADLSYQWDKQADLKRIGSFLGTRSGPIAFEASAGGFFFTWHDGKTTIHTERQWWQMQLWENYQKEH